MGNAGYSDSNMRSEESVFIGSSAGPCLASVSADTRTKDCNSALVERPTLYDNLNGAESLTTHMIRPYIPDGDDASKGRLNLVCSKAAIRNKNIARNFTSNPGPVATFSGPENALERTSVQNIGYPRIPAVDIRRRS